MGGGDQCWVGAGSDQLSDELLGIGGADDRHRQVGRWRVTWEAGADLLVVGTGVAGLTAALRAREAGLHAHHFTKREDGSFDTDALLDAIHAFAEREH